jgi:hypothetical protein
MTDAELFAVAEANGMTFGLIPATGQVCIGTPLLGLSRERRRRVCEIDREMSRRWGRFVAYVKARMKDAGRK